MELDWKPHYLYPVDLSQAHHNGYSVLRANTKHGRFMLGGSKYEIMPGKIDDIGRYDTLEEVIDYIK